MFNIIPISIGKALDGDIKLISKYGMGIAYDLSEEHARLIVKAVNCHDELVAAIRALIESTKTIDIAKAWDKAEQALAKAEAS